MANPEVQFTKNLVPKLSKFIWLQHWIKALLQPDASFRLEMDYEQKTKMYYNVFSASQYNTSWWGTFWAVSQDTPLHDTLEETHRVTLLLLLLLLHKDRGQSFIISAHANVAKFANFAGFAKKNISFAELCKKNFYGLQNFAKKNLIICKAWRENFYSFQSSQIWLLPNVFHTYFLLISKAWKVLFFHFQHIKY